MTDSVALLLKELRLPAFVRHYEPLWETAAEKGWYPHEGGLMKYRVKIRFGEEPDTMPDGWKFGRVSSVAVSGQSRP